MVRKPRFMFLALLLSTIGLAWPAEVAAQRAVPRGARPGVGAPATGTAVPRTYAPRYYYPYRYSRYYYPRYYYPYAYPYYAPFYGAYYPGFSFGFGFGYGYGWPAAYWGGYGYPYAYPYGYGYGYPYYWDNTGSARLMITPRNAQVYLDGRFVGVVDDFDGTLQRLHVETGEHDLQIYLDGYRTITQKVLFTRGTTLKIETALQPLGPGEAAEPRPVPTRSAPSPDQYERQNPPPYPSAAPAGFGTLSMRVNPVDAVIVVDGEVWDRPQGENRFSIDLAEGVHQVEVRKEGYKPYQRPVEVRRGRTFTLNVSLTPAGPGEPYTTARITRTSLLR